MIIIVQIILSRKSTLSFLMRYRSPARNLPLHLRLLKHFPCLETRLMIWTMLLVKRSKLSETLVSKWVRQTALYSIGEVHMNLY